MKKNKEGLLKCWVCHGTGLTPIFKNKCGCVDGFRPFNVDSFKYMDESDACCPYCGEPIESWEDFPRDEDESFERECPSCEKTFIIRCAAINFVYDVERVEEENG